MSQPVITVEHLSKAYRIGVKEEIPDTLMGAMKNVVTAPWRNFKSLRRLNTSTDSQAAQTETEVPNSLADTLWALRDVSFEVNQGDVVGIIGRNGAGKSTLLKVLSRITEPTSGRAVIRSLLEVGTGFHPELTGRENVYMNGTILGMRKKEIDRKFDEIVDFSGVERFLDTPTKRYSSGMQVRLAFAVAAHLEPEILIIDEVLAVGDVEFQKKCLGKMQDVAKGGRTVLFVSHNMFAVQSLCSTAIQISRGRCEKKTTPENAIQSYLAGQYSNRRCRARFEPSDTRIGDQRLQFTHASFRNAELDEVESVPMGDGFILQLDYKCDSRIASPGFGATLFTEDNQRVAKWRTADYGVSCPPIQNAGRIVLAVPELNILPGNYMLAIEATDGISQCDLIHDAIGFTVSERLIAGIVNVPQQRAIIFTPCKWDACST
jgi:lipopolysaccharide transport system ATP-binding protein